MILKIGGRFGILLTSVLGLSLITFFLIHLAPGGHLERKLTRVQQNRANWSLELSSRELLEMKALYGMDQPLISRYGQWLVRIAKLDLGISRLYQKPVTEVLWPRLVRSFRYGLWSLLLAYSLSFAAGAVAYGCQSFWIKKSSLVFHLALYALPPLLIALTVHWVFQSSGFWTVVLAYVLSNLTLLFLLFRGSFLNESRQTYLSVARAKGLTETQVFFNHLLKNAMIPIWTSLSYSFLSFFVGSLFIEKVFEVDGLGLLAYRATMARDFPVLMAMILFFGVGFLLIRMISEVMIVWCDPRVRGA